MMKKIICSIVAMVLVLIPLIVNAKVPVNDVGGVIIIGSKAYSMNYLMSNLNKDQVAEIDEDLKSQYLYFKLNDNDTKWQSVMGEGPTIDDDTLISKVGNNITLVDVGNRKSIAIRDNIQNSDDPYVISID